jgi:hypothetical protein
MDKYLEVTKFYEKIRKLDSYEAVIDCYVDFNGSSIINDSILAAVYPKLFNIYKKLMISQSCLYFLYFVLHNNLENLEEEEIITFYKLVNWEII